MGDQQHYLIIGVSGTTNAGKTTLVDRLQNMFPDMDTICQDAYFLPPDDKRLEQYIVPEVNHANWEQFGALDMESMMRDVTAWVRSADQGEKKPRSSPVPILLIEGFLIFNHNELKTFFHKKYFMSIDKETCIERRKHRHYNPPDVPGYFEKVVWPMYLVNREALADQTDIAYLKGTDDQEQLAKGIESDLRELISSCSTRDTSS